MRETARLLTREPRYPRNIKLAHHVSPHTAQHHGYAALFRPENLRATIFASVPWFLQDLGTYGIGIFTPTILAAALGHKAVHARNLTDLIANDQLAAKGAALIDLLLMLIIGIGHRRFQCFLRLVKLLGDIMQLLQQIFRNLVIFRQRR